MSQEVYELETLDGIRMPWNLWPQSKVEALRCVLPFAVLYSPVKSIQGVQTVNYPPVLCKGKECGAALNPFASIDYVTKMWICPLCASRNYFPPYYADISPEHCPAELFDSSTTIEYIAGCHSDGPPRPPVYIFIVDTALSEDELDACKSTLEQALQMMPEDCLIGLMSFGTHVHVHELREAPMSKVYVFRGTGDYSGNSVATQLGFRAMARQQPSHSNGMLANKFLVSLEHSEYQIEAAIDSLQVDAHQTVSDHRKARCTGTALQIAAGLVDTGMGTGACTVRLMLFVGGPCTEGRAAMVSKELTKEIRSHKDLEKDAAPLWRSSVQYYVDLTQTLVKNSLTLDVFACALEQSGLAEMKPAIQATGGLAVQTDTFRNPVFKDSLKRLFAKVNEPGFSGRSSCATLEVHVSRDIKVMGMLGCGASARKDSSKVSSTSVGQGKTTQWRLPALDFNTTSCICFEITAEKGVEKSVQEVLILQFSTKYLRWDGVWCHRVTTISRRWVAGANMHDIAHGFDQEAAAVMMARYVTWKMETEEDFDATRWIDRSLIRLCQRLGQYSTDEPASFQLMPEMTFFPGFLFHLRRSQFVQVFGNSPDETAFARLMLMKEVTQHCMLMIQPQLHAYSIESWEDGIISIQPTVLDVHSIVPGSVLFLDTYFYLVVYHGNDIARWRQEGYHHEPGYEVLARLLQQPQEAASLIVRSRFPVPRVVDADNFTVAGRSQSRFLLVKLNPSSTHSSASGAEEIIFTDDVSMEVFLEHLKTLSVQS